MRRGNITALITGLVLASCASSETRDLVRPKPVVAGPALAKAAHAVSTLPTLGAADVRALVAARLEDGSTELAPLFDQMARGEAVTLASEGEMIMLPVPDDMARAIAAMIAAPPNLNTLWGDDPARMAQLVEIARWGEAARRRILQYMMNQLRVPAQQSNLFNQFGPFTGYLGQAWKVMRAMPERADREESRVLLLESSWAVVAEKGRAEHSDEGHLAFLVAWLDQDAAKADAAEGKPLR